MSHYYSGSQPANILEGFMEEEVVPRAHQEPVPIKLLPKRMLGSSFSFYAAVVKSCDVLLPSMLQSVSDQCENVSDQQCAICVSPFSEERVHETNGKLVAVLHSCKHVFHFDCLFQWFHQSSPHFSKQCFRCRYSFSSSSLFDSVI